MSETPKTGDLATTLATWLFYLDQAGHRAKDPAIVSALISLKTANELEGAMRGAAERQDYAEAARLKEQLNRNNSDPDALGQDLVDAIQASLVGESPKDIISWACEQLDAKRIVTEFGADRVERTREIRQATFQNGLPWVAQIIDRFPDGRVGAHWVMVERVTDHVRCMDPYPWDDLHEEIEIPLADFMVKWELSGCIGMRWS